ncbi:MAG: nitrogen regulation protein NR(I), partial [Gammaproteobacteria bacterium]|nr:nitrogen regulation protein NR(I) [Gammaproteobacteria bacterium]
ALKELARNDNDVLPKTINQDTMTYLSSLNWPGNVRQLENTCHWLAVMTSGQTINISDLPTELLAENQTAHSEMDIDWQQTLHSDVQRQLIAGETEIASHIIADVEKVLINAALQKTNGRKNDAAKLLGWGRNTLTRKIKELKL